MTDKTILSFLTKPLNNWGLEQTKVIPTLLRYMAAKKPFEIVFRFISESKTDKQLRSYWRLVGLVLPYLKESCGNIDDKDEASSFIKAQCGYCKEVKTKNGLVMINRSLKVANKKEIMVMIDKLLFICEFYDIKDYELTKQEKELLT
tara:strand:- start:44 stop:484 length:441 start_codon:yes stop_codon:yes gene_type:complete